MADELQQLIAGLSDEPDLHRAAAGGRDQHEPEAGAAAAAVATRAHGRLRSVADVAHAAVARVDSCVTLRVECVSDLGSMATDGCAVTGRWERELQAARAVSDGSTQSLSVRDHPTGAQHVLAAWDAMMCWASLSVVCGRARHREN
jgi:hypothetical protein